jgi:hypothetical protein
MTIVIVNKNDRVVVVGPLFVDVKLYVRVIYRIDQVFTTADRQGGLRTSLLPNLNKERTSAAI